MGHTELLKGLLTLHVGAVDIRICYFCCCYFLAKLQHLILVEVSVFNTYLLATN